MAVYPYSNSPTWTLHFEIIASKYDVPTSFHGFKANLYTVEIDEKLLYQNSLPADAYGGPYPQTEIIDDIMARYGVICYEMKPPSISFVHLEEPHKFILLDWSLRDGPTHFVIYYNIMGHFGPGPFVLAGSLPKTDGFTSVGAGGIIQAVYTSSLLPISPGVFAAGQVLLPGAQTGVPELEEYMRAVVPPSPYVGACPFGNNKIRWLATLDPTFVGLAWRVIHDLVVKTHVYPPDGTLVMDGGQVVIEAVPYDYHALSSFTVDGTSYLSMNPYLKMDVHADVHVSAVSIIGTLSAQAAVPFSQTITLGICADCIPTTWSATGLPTGLSMGATTGTISGTIPYGTTPGDYPVTITADNRGRTTSRDIVITVAEPPVYGTTWTALARVGAANAAVTALFQTSTGRVLVGVGNATNGSAIYYSDDLVTFTDFDPAGATLPKRSQSITNFHEGASGRIFATTDITGARPMLLYSDDDGVNWTVALNANGTSNAGDLVYFGSDTVMIPVITSLGRLRILWSTDNGATWPAPNYFEYNPGPVLLSGRMLLTDDLHIVTSMTGVTTGSYIIKHDTTNDGAVYTDSTAGAVRGNPTKDSASKLLMPLQTLLLDGGVSGASFTTRYTAAGNIGVAKYLTQSVGLLGLNGSPVSVLRSTDDMNTFGATTGTLDGTLCYCMCFLANGQILFGTNGTTTNLWRSTS